MAELMVSVSGIRGIIGESLTPEVIVNYVSGFAEFIDGKKIVIGRDSRESGDFITNILKGVLVSKGYDFIDLGIVPTPTVLLTVEELEADGGIGVTASHNPQKWNALKLVSGRGMFLTGYEGKKFLDIVKKHKYNYTKYNKIGKGKIYRNAVNNHINKILKTVNTEIIKEKNFKVVLDCVNGAGGVMSPKLLEKLGCEVVTINEEPHGKFPRTPEP
ncbi:MAG: phosphoglucosamine mutase, partial [Candidatus Mcinerneyibacterium aminivorans]